MEIKAKSKKIADLKMYLETERARLQKEIAQSDISTDEERAGYSNHMAESATLVFEQAKNAILKRTQERLLSEVEDALKRIANGSYGVCTSCAQAIDAARLKAQPPASLCLSCQERAEHR